MTLYTVIFIFVPYDCPIFRAYSNRYCVCFIIIIVEWEEWGNPNEEKYHQYMMEYSPINNVQSGSKYPACLLTGGLYDPRVQVRQFIFQMENQFYYCFTMDHSHYYHSCPPRYIIRSFTVLGACQICSRASPWRV